MAGCVKGDQLYKQLYTAMYTYAIYICTYVHIYEFFAYTICCVLDDLRRDGQSICKYVVIL